MCSPAAEAYYFSDGPNVRKLQTIGDICGRWEKFADDDVTNALVKAAFVRADLREENGGRGRTSVMRQL